MRYGVFPETQYLETIFPDGTKVPAAPTPEHGYAAKEHGYTSTWEFVREHELLHTYLSEKAGLDGSPTLRALALGQADDPYSILHTNPSWTLEWTIIREETLVCEFAKYMNGKPYQSWPFDCFLRGVHLPSLAAFFRLGYNKSGILQL